MRPLAGTAILALLAVFSIPQEAADPAASEQAARARDATIQRAADLLVSFQEDYRADPPVGRFRTDKDLEEWRTQEADRLGKLRTSGQGREWPYEGVYRTGGVVPPGYRVGGTSIACWALMEVPEWEAHEDRRQAVRRGLRFVLDGLERDPLLESGFLGGYDVRGWAHIYGLRVLLRARERKAFQDASLERRAERSIPRLLKTLQETAIAGTGGWNYSRPQGGDKPAPASTFMTASGLLALFEAQGQGFDVDAACVKRALDVLAASRTDEGGVGYGSSIEGPTGRTTIPGSAARAPATEAVLLLAGRGDAARLRRAVDGFFRDWDELEQRRGQQGTHQGPHGIAPYYFHYGHTYAALAIELLPEADRPARREQLRALYARTQQPDGGWNDRIFPRSAGYSTAMAPLGLLMPGLPAPARWQP